MANKHDKTEVADRSCQDCGFYNDEHKRCIKEGGLLHHIEHMSESMSEAQHDCKEFTEARYTLTPKGIFSLALDKAGIEWNMEQLDEAFDSFVEGMEQHGYLQKDDEED